VASQQDKLHSGVAAYLDPGEEVRAAIVASAKGYHAQMASHGLTGTRSRGETMRAAKDAGLVVASPMGFVVTSRRVLTLKLGMIIGLGMGGAVKGLLSAVPLTDVDGMETSRLGLNKLLDVTVHGVTIRLEATVSTKVDELIAAFIAAKAAAG